MAKVSEDIFFKALDKWLKENSDKTINDIKFKDVSIIDGEPIKIGVELSRIRTGEKTVPEEFKKKLEKDYGFSYELKSKKYPEEMYMKAIVKWVEENSDKTINEIPVNEVIDVDGEKILVGKKIGELRTGKVEFSEENMNILYTKYKFSHDSRSNKVEDEYFLGALKIFMTKKQKEDKDFNINMIKRRDTEEFNGKLVSIGSKLSELRSGKSNFEEKTVNILVGEYGFIIEKKYVPTKEEWMEIIEKWFNDNPSKTQNDIGLDELIEYKGKLVNIGNKFSRMRFGESLLSPKNMKILKEKYGFKPGKKEKRKNSSS